MLVGCAEALSGMKAAAMHAARGRTSARLAKFLLHRFRTCAAPVVRTSETPR
jgi:hypothetical protein